MAATGQLPSSFRDPSGFVFLKDNIYYRHIHNSYKNHYIAFIQSGCYEELVKDSLILRHEEINENLTGHPDWFLTLKPEQLKYTSQPCEWSFDMLKDAAKLTLQILKKCIHKGIILKDASAYNIQLHKGKMIFIDSLSFEEYNEALPWVAYRQFCESFLGPLLISHYSKQSLNKLFLSWPDGIPVDIIQSLLPARSKFSLHVYLHIHLHARVIRNEREKERNQKKSSFTKQKLIRLIESLWALLNNLKSPGNRSTWSNYYDEAVERGNYLVRKQEIVTTCINELTDITSVADIGANDGFFSKLTANKGIFTIAADADPVCINNLYKKVKEEKTSNIHPLILDISNPTPALGLLNEERTSFLNQGRFDLVLALALIHHLAISKNIPLNKVAEIFERLTKKYLIIEFVPKEDEKTTKLLNERIDVFKDYSARQFEDLFQHSFVIITKTPVSNSGRTIYLMKKQDHS